MTQEVIFVVLMFAVFAGGLFAGFPVAFVLGGTGILFAVLGDLLPMVGIKVMAGTNFIGFSSDRIFGSLSNYSLVPIAMFVCVVLRVGNGVAGGNIRRSGWWGHVHMHTTERKQHKSDQNESGQSTSHHLRKLLFVNAVHSECWAPGLGRVNSSWSFPGYSFRTTQHSNLPKARGRKVLAAHHRC